MLTKTVLEYMINLLNKWYIPILNFFGGLMYFGINKSSPLPVYVQLASEIRDKVHSNEFSKGHRMPPERELADKLGISRGTVKKSYDLLIKEGLLEAIQGSGTYVSGKVSGKNVNAKESVARLIEFLSDAGYSIGEIESMLYLGLKDKMNTGAKIAAIECNEETLKIIEKQLQYVNISFEHFQLEDVLNFRKGDEVFENFKLIFTTTTHYNLLEKVLPNTFNSGKITRIAVSADFSTIMDIGSLGEIGAGELGVFTKSARFAEIIRHNLRNFKIFLNDDDYLLADDTDTERFREFISTRRCIIVPPIYTLNIDNSINNLLLNYYKDGKKIITFNYIIEKGSLLHLEELIR